MRGWPAFPLVPALRSTRSATGTPALFAGFFATFALISWLTWVESWDCDYKMTLYSRLAPTDRFKYAFLHTLDPLPTSEPVHVDVRFQRR